MADVMADYEEVNDALSAPIGPVVDEDDLADELAELEGELEDEEYAEIAKDGGLEDLDALPVAPTKSTISAITFISCFVFGLFVKVWYLFVTIQTSSVPPWCKKRLNLRLR